MALDVSAFDAVLKTFYGPALIKLVNDKTRILDMFTKNNDKSLQVDGRNVIYPIHTGRNPAVGAIGENKTLPVAQNQVTTSVTIPYKFNYARIQLSIQTIKQSMTSRGAFKKAMELETKNAVLDCARDRNRQLFGYGTGVLALVSGSNGAGTSVQLKAPGGVALPGGVVGRAGAGRLLLPNQYVAFVRNATPANAADTDIVSGSSICQVSSLSADLSTLTTVASTGATLNDGDMVINAAANVVTESSVNKECMGLLGIVDDGTYLNSIFGVNRTTYPQYKGTVISVNGNLSLEALQRAFDLADEKGGDTRNMVLFAHHSTRREYLNLLNPVRRYTGEQVNSPDGGWKGQAIATDITFSDRPIMVERFCPLGMIFGIDKSFNTRYVLTEGEWADDDNSVLNRVLNVDAYEARFRIFDNFHNDRPDTCFRLDNITITYDASPVE